jgi:hypothetical protein
MLSPKGSVWYQVNILNINLYQLSAALANNLQLCLAMANGLQLPKVIKDNLEGKHNATTISNQLI